MDQRSLWGRAVLWPGGCSAASLAGPWVLLASPAHLLRPKNVSRLGRVLPGGPICPQLRTAGLVALALDSTADRIFPSPQTILWGSPLYRSSSGGHLYNENLIPTQSLGMNFSFGSCIESANWLNRRFLNGGIAGLEGSVFLS